MPGAPWTLFGGSSCPVVTLNRWQCQDLWKSVGRTTNVSLVDWLNVRFSVTSQVELKFCTLAVWRFGSFTLIVTDPTAESGNPSTKDPSLARYVNESVPVKPPLGVYVKEPSGFSVNELA